MRHSLRLLAVAAVAAVAAGTGAVALSGPAEAHGAAMVPGSRTFLCWVDGLTPTGQIDPANPACDTAADSDTNAFYNWFSVLRPDAAGRTEGFIPDGRLCSADVPMFHAFDEPRLDWPKTQLTSGDTIQIRYSNWAAHPGRFDLYVTRDGWDPTAPLGWDDLEPVPFDSVTDPPASGPPGGDEYYYWEATLPDGKSGYHVIYSHWVRSDSQENFYGCSDVLFNGGDGDVDFTGTVGVDPQPEPSPTPSGSPSPTATPSPTPDATCSASYEVTSSWPDGFQGGVTVTNTGEAQFTHWMVTLVFAGGEAVTETWGAEWPVSPGAQQVAHNAPWNGVLAPGEATSFGFLASGSPGQPAYLACQVHAG